MSSSGRFRIARDIFYDWTADDRPWCSLALWLYIIGRGQYRETTVTFLGHKFSLTRGQLVTSASHLCETAGWTPQRLRSFLARCVKDGKITVTGTPCGTVITVIKYDKWQSATEQQTIQQTKQQSPKQSTTDVVLLEQQAQQQSKQQQSIEGVQYLRCSVSKEDQEIRSSRQKNIGDDPVVSLYSRICVPKGLPSVKALTPKRETAIKRVVETYGLERLEALFEKAVTADFLLGKNDRGWKADFDFLLRPDVLVRIDEGSRYFDQGGTNGTDRKRGYRPSIEDAVFTGEDFISDPHS